jgi:hypothetical protein
MSLSNLLDRYMQGNKKRVLVFKRRLSVPACFLRYRRLVLRWGGIIRGSEGGSGKKEREFGWVSGWGGSTTATSSRGDFAYSAETSLLALEASLVVEQRLPGLVLSGEQQYLQALPTVTVSMTPS